MTNRVALEVNRKLKHLWKEKNIYLTDHSNMITIRHLIGSKLHLDKRGMRILFNILVESVSNVLQ